ncbi:MAG: hypothetical protein QM766_27520 [Burkholderiaceae bacterium]
MAAKADFPAVPPSLSDVALIDGRACAAASGVGMTKWNDLVARGLAPQPVIRRPRFTRWQAGQVRQWLIDQASNSTAFASTACEPNEMANVLASATAASPAEGAKPAKPRAASQ